VHVKNLSFAHMDVGKGREQDAEASPIRLSEHFLHVLWKQELVLEIVIQLIFLG